MVAKSPPYHVLSEQDWHTVAPEMGRHMLLDAQIVDLVSDLLQAPDNELDVIIAAVRYMVSERDDEPCDDDKLKSVIDDASWLLSNPETYAKHGLAKRASPRTYRDIA